MERSWREALSTVLSGWRQVAALPQWRGQVAEPCQWRRRVMVLLLVASFGSVAVAAPARAVDDPLEPLNRGIFEFNRIVDGLVLKPASQIYVFAVPEPGRRGVSNFLSNLRAPVVFINHLLQGEGEQAGITFGRFFVNSTLGFLGIFDAATVFGVEPRREADFGQTLGVWGVGGGAYLVLPLFGPSTFRDAGGIAVDTFLFDPLPYLSDSDTLMARWGATAVDTRYQYGPLLDDLEAASLDFYAAARSAFLQNRAAQIRRGVIVRDETYESIFDEDFDNGFDDDFEGLDDEVGGDAVAD
jgi:phospholipid-binding lipoprotein MlaA